LFAFIQAAGRQLPERLRGRQPELPHQQDAVLLIDGHHHRRPHMPHDRPLYVEAARIGGLFLGYAKEAAFVYFTRRDDFHSSLTANWPSGSVFMISAGASQPRRAVMTP